MRKVDQYKVITTQMSGRVVIRSRKSVLAAIGDALDALERGCRVVRLEGIEGFVDFRLLEKALRGKPLSKACYAGADLDIGGRYWSLFCRNGFPDRGSPLLSLSRRVHGCSSPVHLPAGGRHHVEDRFRLTPSPFHCPAHRGAFFFTVRSQGDAQAP